MILARKSRGRKLLPMVKADAYGHDAAWVARTLWSDFRARKMIHGFGVATFEEAVDLREKLPKSSKKIPVIVFSDCAPYSDRWIRLCQTENFEPVLGDLRTFLEFQKRMGSLPESRRIPYHLEVNTGMNRLGIPVSSLKLVLLKPESVFTHFAESENPGSVLTQKQISRFNQVIQWKNRSFPESRIHFANSGAIWNARHYSFFDEMDLVRPGLSLYGIRPDQKFSNDGLRPVMTFAAPIIQKLFLEKGERVGYGGSYRAKNPKGEWVAALGAGYADGIFRSLANQENVLGMVSMDLITVKSTAKTKVGDWVVLWGEGLDPYLVAGRAKTIPYEITTRIGRRVEKIYE